MKIPKNGDAAPANFSIIYNMKSASLAEIHADLNQNKKKYKKIKRINNRTPT